MSLASTVEDEDVVSSLHKVFRRLEAHPFPVVECPPRLNKRASVALIIRINPRYPDKAPGSTTDDFFASEHISETLDEFFSQEWVHRGDPEALFIKRAARKGDRWEGHIALPGGRRDEGDNDDQAAAIRETNEEVGIDLSNGRAICVGNLPQRLVTTSWGKVPLMVSFGNDLSSQLC